MKRSEMIDAIVAMQQDPDKKKKIKDKLTFMKTAAVAQIYAAATGKASAAAAQAPAVQQAAKQVMAAQQAAIRTAMGQAPKGARGASEAGSKPRSKSKSKSKSLRSTMKSATMASKSGKSRTKDPSKAKNVEELKSTLIRVGYTEKDIKGKSRPVLEQMIRRHNAKRQTTRGGGTGTVAKLPKSYRGDYARMIRLMKAGVLGERTINRQMTGKLILGVQDIPLNDIKERYDKFFEIYTPQLKNLGLGFGAGARGKVPKGKELVGKQLKSAPRKSKSKGKSKVSVKAAFAAIKQQGKMPYYLAPGYTRVVGGGASGPGRVLTVPGSGATPFGKLSDDEKRSVLRWLNSEAGKKMRAKGAKRVVQQQKVISASKSVTKGRKSRKPKAA
jgi:hypothetical protein